MFFYFWGAVLLLLIFFSYMSYRVSESKSISEVILLSAVLTNMTLMAIAHHYFN